MIESLTQSQAGGCLDGKQHLSLGKFAGASGMQSLADAAGQIAGGGGSEKKNKKEKKDKDKKEKKTKKVAIVGLFTFVFFWLFGIQCD